MPTREAIFLAGAHGAEIATIDSVFDPSFGFTAGVVVGTPHNRRRNGEGLLARTSRRFEFDQGDVVLRIMHTQGRENALSDGIPLILG